MPFLEWIPCEEPKQLDELITIHVDLGDDTWSITTTIYLWHYFLYKHTADYEERWSYALIPTP